MESKQGILRGVANVADEANVASLCRGLPVLASSASCVSHTWPRACVTSARVVNRSREQEVFSCCSRACETNKLRCAHVRRVATAVDDALASTKSILRRRHVQRRQRMTRMVESLSRGIANMM